MLSDAAPVGLPWIVILAFVQITTRAGITGTAGNLTSDAHVTVLALERGASVCSTDHDYARFPGIRHDNPLIAG